MASSLEQRGVFVASRTAVSGAPGGVQLCTDEYRKTLRLAGWQLHDVVYDTDKRLLTRIKRRFFPAPYKNRVASDLIRVVADEVKKSNCTTIFLNQCEVLEIVEELRNSIPGAKIVFLSHGLESMDYLHTLRARGYGKPFAQNSKSEQTILASQLVTECRQRLLLDGTICLSEIEVELERWLGAKKVMCAPRAVAPKYLDWRPVKERVGFVGTLDHPPNAEGLILFLRELDKLGSDVTVRVVGGPEAVGKEIASEFPRVQYLGSLSNEALCEEACTWSCFLHPLFCYPRGASTKLAVGISWGIPIVTTTAGRRGYQWREGELIEAIDAPSFTSMVCDLCRSPEQMNKAQADVRKVCSSSPSLESIAAAVERFLASL